MKKSQLRQIVKEEIKKILTERENPLRAPEPTTIPVKPDTEKERERRRTISPPEQAPDTRPKALMKEEEKELMNKIAKRFKTLNNG